MDLNGECNEKININIFQIGIKYYYNCTIILIRLFLL